MRSGSDFFLHSHVLRKMILKSITRTVVAATFMLAISGPAFSQTFPTDDPVIKQMWELGIENSMTRELAHELMDVIGPRLTGTAGLANAQDWVYDKYESWGVNVSKEEVGSWLGWEQGILHVDMISPRVASLEAELLAWSPGTDGPVEGLVAVPPANLTSENVEDWLSTIKGKFVMTSAPEAMCRANQELEANARPETVAKLQDERRAQAIEWNSRMNAIGDFRSREAKLDSAGVSGFISSRWSGGWGVNKVFSTNSRRGVAIDMSCEDYGLLFRLSENGQTPRLKIDAQANYLGDVPILNVIGKIPGSELPNEYVLLGAHLDSWHAATGATDNGTGSITMLEAMRILKSAYPNPKRTILVGHWTSEEQGLIGSGAFREDHPEVIEGLQAAFNQDNGTWRFERLEGQGFLASSVHLPKWMAAVPTEISSHVIVEVPGAQNNSGSDHTSFVCAQAPSFRLQSPYDEYRQYTWHTNRDTYDKIVFDDLSENATLAAMLAYMASEDDVRFDRTLANLPPSQRTGQARNWPNCRPARRSNQ